MAAQSSGWVAATWQESPGSTSRVEPGTRRRDARSRASDARPIWRDGPYTPQSGTARAADFAENAVQAVHHHRAFGLGQAAMPTQEVRDGKPVVATREDAVPESQ